jgi:hypothetical protein
LVRPTGAFLFAGADVAWLLTVGWREGAALTAVAVAVAALVVVPWTVRNEVVLHGFLPISIQDDAAYGTFNADSAADPVFPYAWRPLPPSYSYLYDPRHPVSDLKFRALLQGAARHYIAQHPASLPQAFFWNGLSRLWDVRRPARALEEVRFEGRSRTVTKLGLWMYYALLPAALIGLWRWRRRRALVGALLATALGASLVFTIDSGTRYRAPFEPLIVVLACAALPWLRARPEPASTR